MAKTIKRTVSDLDAQSIESFLNGGSSYEYDSYSNESSYVDPVLGQEVLDVLTDSDPDHGTFMMEAYNNLNEATTIQRSIEYYVETRALKIKMCNAFSKASKAKGYGIEAIDFWRSMEADDDMYSIEYHKSKKTWKNKNNTGKGTNVATNAGKTLPSQQQAQNNSSPATGTGTTNTNNAKKDSGNNSDDDKWYKRFWEAVKAFFKKLIMAVINFIKSVGNFIKGAICKAQDLFYKKYAKDVKANIKRYADNPENKDLKFKMKCVGDGKLWENAPWVVLKSVSAKLTQGFATVHQSAMGASNALTQQQEQEVARYMKNATTAATGFLTVEGSKNIGAIRAKIDQQAGRFFPSAGQVVNLLIYGKEKPSKNELSLMTVVNGETIEILSPAALTQMTFAYKTAQQANKSLSNFLKMADKMSRQTRKFESGDAKGRKMSQDTFSKFQNMSRFMTSILITLYGECLSARIKVFSAAKKLYKKGEYADDENNK